MFAVDCSASMRSKTDFEVNDDTPIYDDDEPTAEKLVEGHFFTRISFEDVKDHVGKHESFGDIVAIVAGETETRRRIVATQIIGLVRGELSQKIVANHVKVERLQGLAGYGNRMATNAARAALDKIKEYWAALQTHETSLVDFLIFRATTTQDVATHWIWYQGQDIPAGAPTAFIPTLPPHITFIPEGLQCPISHGLMEDAVTAPDNHTYSRSAIKQWFAIRKSSPMTGLELQDTTLVSNDATSAAVAAWILGNDTLSRTSRPVDTIKMTFNSRDGSFERDIDISNSITSLYGLAFAGLKARFTAFQLAKDGQVLNCFLAASLRDRGFKNGDEIIIRIPDDGDIAVSTGGLSTSRASGEMCLIKVYDAGACDHPAFSYWVKRDTNLTMNSILFKFWRYKFSSGGLSQHSARQVWTGMSSSGDGMCVGSPATSDQRLATYLNRSHCNGHLNAEPLFYQASEVEAGIPDIPLASDPLVLKVSIQHVYSNKRARDASGVLSRLDVLKNMFEALINRLIAYNYKTHVGLITFASKAKVSHNISHVLENFRRATSQMNASGDTALWDALALSLDQVQEMAVKYPHAKKRIIVISDGVNTTSTANTCEDIAWKMQTAGVAVDTISLGAEENQDLRALSWLLGCYSFHPTSLANALSICEMEPFLSATQRPTIISRSKAVNRLGFRSSFLTARFTARDTVVTEDRFPARKEHENLADEFVQLSGKLTRASNGTQNGTRSTFRITRVMKEINQLVSREHPNYDIYVSETNLAFWKAVMSGPEDSPYSAGTFLLYLDMKPNYPTFAPEARFITKMLHPNVNAHGRVCHPLFGRDWTTDTSMTTVLDTIYGLLFQAEVSDPVSTLSTLEYHADGVEFAEAVRDHVHRHAMESRDEWQAEVLGEVEADMDENDLESSELSDVDMEMSRDGDEEMSEG